MKQFMTAQELADAALPVLPQTKRRINELASRENWPSRPREGRGGGREYAVYALPQAALSELAFRDVQNAALTQKQDDAPLDPYGAPKASARACVLQMLDNFMANTGLTSGVAAKLFTERYNDKALNVLPWILKYFPSLSARSLRRWKQAATKKGTSGLEDKKRGPQGASRWDTDENLQAYVVAQIAGKPHVRTTTVYEGVAANFENPPSLRSLQLYIKKYKEENASALMYAENPDQWKSHRRSAFGSLSADVIRLNQKWEIDGTISDLQCLDEGSTLTRFQLVALVDVYSRRSKVLVTRQPSAIATAALLRTSILDWGLPEILKADNGKDYTAAHVQRIASDLGFAIDYCTPFSPEQKPHVERFFGTLSRELFEILPGYVGHSVADAQAIRARKSMGQRFAATKTAIFTLTAGELQAVINDWLENKYERRVHRGLKTTPFQQALKGRARLVEDERALDLLLAPAPDQNGVRKVQKKGISVFNRWYISAELGGIVGDRVSVRIDPENTARIVVYSVEDQSFICVAEDVLQTGANAREIANRARQMQSSELKKLRIQHKAATAAHNPDKLASDILGHAAQKASKVHAIRAPYTDQLLTPAMEQAREAAQALDSPHSEPAPLSDLDVDEANEMIAKIEAPTPKPSLTVYSSDPSQRPQFALGMQGDYDFWKWAHSLENIDEATAAELAELEAESAFQLFLQTQHKTIKTKGAL